MKFKYSGINSSQSSMINTRRTYNLMEFFFFFVSNMSNAARFGTKRIDLNSSWPSTEKCFTDKWSSQSLEIYLYRTPYSSFVTSSGFRNQRGFVLFKTSNSEWTSLTFFFFLSFFSSDSSLISTSSFFSLSSVSLSLSSSSVTSFSSVFST